MKEMISLGLKFHGGFLKVLDQQRLPHEELWLDCSSPQDMAKMILDLKVRGAPLIGVAAAMSLAHYSLSNPTEDKFRIEAKKLRDARPTAVNLMAAVDRILASKSKVSEAEKIFDEDVRLCDNIAKHGEPLINDGDSVLTHCNTGGLATAGIGTALGVLRRAHENKKKIHVYVDETRPLLQGARLTTWELEKLGIPYTLICDNMAATLMQKGRVQKVIVGSDRIARNGDLANKIGTYSLAVNAHYHKVPFYVAAPQTTVDPYCETGSKIPVEERDSSEIRGTFSPKNSKTFNPAFDVTPNELVSAIILDNGVFKGREFSQYWATRS